MFNKGEIKTSTNTITTMQTY